MKTIVLGAGVIGVTTAYYLSRAGHEVHVLEQHSNVGLETSFANGGQISVSHPEPWASTDTLWKLLRGLSREDTPFRIHLHRDPAMWMWGLSFLRNCTVRRQRRNASLIARLAIYSQKVLEQLCADTAIRFHHHKPGTLHIFAKPRALDNAVRLAETRRTFGIKQEIVDYNGCVRIEPALAVAGKKICGGIYAPDDETGDALLFTQALARICAQQSVVFHYDATITGLSPTKNRITAINTTKGRFTSDNVVLALGAASPLVINPLSLRLPIYPVKGYSISLPVTDEHTAPGVNIIYEARRIVTSRLGEFLRIAGGADFGGYDTHLDTSRVQAILSAAIELFPNPGDTTRATDWAGFRPMTPDGIPFLGATPYRNLYLNTGHGSLGWTLACGSARVLSDLICGHEPQIGVRGYSLSRLK